MKKDDQQLNFFLKTLCFNVILSILSIVLVIFRIILSGDTYFVFLIWNIFLAIIPLLLFVLLLISYKTKRYILSLVLLTVWFFIFPNALYLLTDIIHFHNGYFLSFYYDYIMLILIAFLGISISFTSIYTLQKVVLQKFTNYSQWFFIISLIIIQNYGIFIGRFLRLNSWDIITRPIDTILYTLMPLINPVWQSFTFLTMFSFSLLIIYLYCVTFKLLESLNKK